MNLWVAVLFGIGILAIMLGVLFLILLVVVKIRVHAIYTQEDDPVAKQNEATTKLKVVKEINSTEHNENKEI